MNIHISKTNCIPKAVFKQKQQAAQDSVNKKNEESVVSVYGDNPIRTNPAQLSLFHMHDFHGQNIKMERAYTVINQFDNGTLQDYNTIFDTNEPIDKLKFCSGDMFLGENPHELEVVNDFLNISGVLANTIGNHECDYKIEDFAAIVKNRNYKFLGANMHPDNDSVMGSVLSDSFIVESNGNQYGVIGLSPADIAQHMKRPDEIDEFNVSNIEQSIEDLQKEIDKLKKEGVNKIILLSHLGLENEQYIAQNINDVDIILGGHTHNLLTEVKEGENLFMSPKGEPVLIMQIGRDGEYMGIPNIKFNELGQITGIQYNVIKTDDYARSLIAKNSFEKYIGHPEVVGSLDEVENPPKDIYATENPHCNFILDSMRSVLNTDIALMNSANIRGRFYKGSVDTRDLRLISPFANRVAVVKVTEEEIVNNLNRRVAATMASPVHRPGIIQVSGLTYKYSQSEGKITEMNYIDKEGNVIPIDIENPSKDKWYTLACDDFCLGSDESGLNLKHRLDNAIALFDYDKDECVAQFLRKQTEPMNVRSDGRIEVVE